MPGPNVTYLLGAGASCETLPLVKEIKADPIKNISRKPSLAESMGQLAEIVLSTGIDQKHSKEQMQLIDWLKWLCKESNEHYTIDTYAKKLFVRNDKLNLQNLKLCLALYLIIEQSRHPIDKRYISFLAAILETKDNGEIHIPKNIRILSWNYDIQPELAFGNYLDLKDVSDIHQSLDISPSPNSSNAGFSPSIVHLNGVAGLYKLSKGGMNNAFSRTESKDLRKILEAVLFMISSHDLTVNETLSFAWERYGTAKTSLEHALNIARETEYLVVIGYSFPFFNRKIDRQIIEAMNTSGRLKKIYYQDPDFDGSSMYNQFGINPTTTKVQHVKEVNQFFLPHEL